MLILGQKPQILESFSVCVAIQLKETGLCSGISVVYVIFYVEGLEKRRQTNTRHAKIFTTLLQIILIKLRILRT